MAKLVDKLEKRIYKTRPTTEFDNQNKSSGQYNYGKVDAQQANYIMGIKSDSLIDDMDLYSVVETKYDPNEDIEKNPYGYMNGASNPSVGRESYIKFHHVISSTLYGDTDSDYFYHGHYSLWMYDGFEVVEYGGNAKHAIGNTGNNRGKDLRWGLIGAGGDLKYIVYPNGDIEDNDGNPMDGTIWKDKSRGHLLGSRALGEVDQEHTLVDALYDSVDGSWHACGDWSAKSAQGISGWESWNKALPLEYCFGRKNTDALGGVMYTGDANLKPDYWAAPGDWNSVYDPQSDGEWDETDWTQFDEYLKGELNNNDGYWKNGGHSVICSTRYWSEDDDCNQTDNFGLLTGECPDESLPFYCGPGLALERFNDTDEGNTFTRGMETELGVGTNKVEDFHLGWHQNYRPQHPPFHQGGPDRLVEDGQTFSDYLRGIKPTENRRNIIYMIVVLGGDEREKIWGLEGKVDERDRQYTRINIPKNYLYEIWKNQKGEVKTFNFTYRYDATNYAGTREKSHSTQMSKIEWENGWGSQSRAHNYLDDRGELAGYIGEIEYFDDKLTATRLNHVRIKVKAPTFDPLISIKSILEGGMNANWVDSTKTGWWCINANDVGSRGYRRGLNPKYDIDFVGFPSSFYQNADSDGKTTGNKYLKETLLDFRPISYVEPVNIPASYLCTADSDLDSWDGQIDEDCAPYGDDRLNCNNQAGCVFSTVDLQSYYEGGSTSALLAKAYSSAPNDIKLYFRLADGANTATPIFWDDGTNPDLEEFHSNLKYWFFVTNWDWKDGDPGGGDCEESQSQANCMMEIANTFPISDFELEVLNGEGEDLYKIVSLSDEPDYDTFARHQYVEPGVKIIKALVFATNDISSDYWGNSWCVDKPCEDYSNFRQAFHWKLVTIKINLNGDGVFPSPDFGDLGGDDFVYLPMPDIMNLYEQGDAPSGNPYKSSHVIVSGLSEESQYIKSLNEIYREDNFTNDEIDEKNTLYRARNSSPIGMINELGDYLGDSDLAQVRYYNNVVVEDDITTTTDGEPLGILDMRKFLGIETVDLSGDFHPYNDFNYWTGRPPYEEAGDIVTEPAFPKESPVGDIFINEYNQFRELCLFEFNFSNLDGKSMTDSSGNGNKGILIGDYSIKKEAGVEAIRESYIKIPETEKDNGAF